MTPPVPAKDVRVLSTAKEDFFQRHRKAKGRAEEVWRSLVAKREALLADVAFGPLFQPPRLPSFLKGLAPLRVVKGLPHGYRAIYTVFRMPPVGLVVQVEWVGDHKEYDALFGYSTS
jgi:hypothetical protein